MTGCGFVMLEPAEYIFFDFPSLCKTNISSPPIINVEQMRAILHINRGLVVANEVRYPLR